MWASVFDVVSHNLFTVLYLTKATGRFSDLYCAIDFSIRLAIKEQKSLVRHSSKMNFVPPKFDLKDFCQLIASITAT